MERERDQGDSDGAAPQHTGEHQHAEAIAAAARAALPGLPLVEHRLDIAGRTFRALAVADHDALLRVADRFATFPYGLLLWDSAPALARALAARPQSIAGKSVVDIGAGVGLAGLAARHLGASVTLTDHSAEALVLCRANAALNEFDDVEVIASDWSSWTPAIPAEVILGADVLYDAGQHNAVLGVLTRSLAPGGRVLLTDPDRPDTPRFLAMLETAGWRPHASPAPRSEGSRQPVTIIEAIVPRAGA